MNKATGLKQTGGFLITTGSRTCAAACYYWDQSRLMAYWMELTTPSVRITVSVPAAFFTT